MPVIIYYKETDGVLLISDTQYVSTRSNGRSVLLLKDFEQETEEKYVNRMTGQVAYLTTMQEGADSND